MSDVGVFLLMFVAVLILVAVIRFFAWLTEVQEAHGSLPRATAHAIQRYVSVNHSDQSDDNVMSRAAAAPALSAALSLQTDSRQTADRPALSEPSRQIMFDVFMLMRKYGIPREEARPVLKAAGWKLDNNLWADAAPPDPERLTPIAGRPTRAEFQTDPDYPYQAPS